MTARPSTVACVAFALAAPLAACDRAAAPSAPVAAAVTPAPVAAKPPSAPAPKEYVLTSRKAKVRVRFTPPAGWTEWKPGDDFVTYQAPGMALGSSHLTVGLTCHGSCVEKGFVARAPKNIGQVAHEAFDFVKSKNHIPQLEPVWLSEPKQEQPSLFYTRWDAKRDGKVAEAHVEIDRVLGDVSMILSCSGEMERDGIAAIDTLEKACRSLELEVMK